MKRYWAKQIMDELVNKEVKWIWLPNLCFPSNHWMEFRQTVELNRADGLERREYNTSMPLPSTYDRLCTPGERGLDDAVRSNGTARKSRLYGATGSQERCDVVQACWMDFASLARLPRQLCPSRSYRMAYKLELIKLALLNLPKLGLPLPTSGRDT